MSNATITINMDDGLKPEEVARKQKQSIRELSRNMSSTPDITEVEQNINDNLKGLSRREAFELLSKIRGCIIGNAPIDLGFEEIL
ncbi:MULTISPECIES: hypothetical protein [unclassified Oceanobacillus]|uniref:hypothetical protein n=1 Tax=unclassified Oceanobacillus TaxID=2630292 RepID=UPI001BE9F36C|nr:MULTISPECIES: hypothetical protein [unclassified Oceanobacillus]MBT2600939.1 hypothetical protein [Oceanobacillus sp. ISL-74]MBT2653610.1 hypothetical protein [Oceanobacillus sp. ISL-73]